MENDYIRGLIDRFLQAETTLEEEDKLYRFFQSDIMPDDLRQYKEMFMAYSGMKNLKDDSLGQDIPDSADSNQEKKGTLLGLYGKMKGAGKKTFKIYQKISIGVAASLLVALLSISAYNHYEESRLEQLYGGSYIIVDGKRIDDLAKIKPQIMDGLHKAEMMEKLSNLDAKQNEIELRMLKNISSDKEKKYIQDLLCD